MQQGQPSVDSRANDRTVSAKSKSPNQGVKKGLPTSGLVAAEELASNLWEIARKGSVPSLAFANKLGRSSSSGNRWDTDMALLRGFGLIERERDQLSLSPLGLEIIDDSDVDRQREAKRKAVMTLKSYRSLVDDFNGTNLPNLQSLATRLKFEYGKSDDFAARAAAAFKETLEHAEMITGDGVVQRDGVATRMPPTPPPIDPEDDVEEEIDQAFDEEEPSEDSTGDSEPPHEESQLTSEVSRSQIRAIANPGINLEVHLDLSNFAASEVVDILKVLGYGDHG